MILDNVASADQNYLLDYMVLYILRSMCAVLLQKE